MMRTVHVVGIEERALRAIDSKKKFGFIKTHDEVTYNEVEKFAAKYNLHDVEDNIDFVLAEMEIYDGFVERFASVVCRETGARVREYNDLSLWKTYLYAFCPFEEEEDKSRDTFENNLKATFTEYLVELGVAECNLDCRSIELDD